MNVFDFDKTIYDGDSTLDFYFFCLKKYPAILIFLPRQIVAAVKYKIGIIDKTYFKQEFYSFFCKIRDMDKAVNDFWDINENKIKDWYLEMQNSDDVVISASPYFLLDEICKRMNVSNLIASEVDSRTGKYIGVNCYGVEKVRRFKEKYNTKIDKFFSDSKSDKPMADIANKAYIVKGIRIIDWSEYCFSKGYKHKTLICE